MTAVVDVEPWIRALVSAEAARVEALVAAALSKTAPDDWWRLHLVHQDNHALAVRVVLL